MKVLPKKALRWAASQWHKIVWGFFLVSRFSSGLCKHTGFSRLSGYFIATLRPCRCRAAQKEEGSTKPWNAGGCWPVSCAWHLSTPEPSRAGYVQTCSQHRGGSGCLHHRARDKGEGTNARTPQVTGLTGCHGAGAFPWLWAGSAVSTLICCPAPAGGSVAAPWQRDQASLGTGSEGALGKALLLWSPGVGQAHMVLSHPGNSSEPQELKCMAQRDQSTHRAWNTFYRLSSVTSCFICTVQLSTAYPALSGRESWLLTDVKWHFLPEWLKCSLCYLFTRVASSCYFEPNAWLQH